MHNPEQIPNSQENRRELISKGMELIKESEKKYNELGRINPNSPEKKLLNAIFGGKNEPDYFEKQLIRRNPEALKKLDLAIAENKKAESMLDEFKKKHFFEYEVAKMELGLPHVEFTKQKDKPLTPVQEYFITSIKDKYGENSVAVNPGMGEYAHLEVYNVDIPEEEK